jgi:hypothetical protein
VREAQRNVATLSLLRSSIDVFSLPTAPYIPYLKAGALRRDMVG